VIAWRTLELIELNGSVEHVQLPECSIPYLWRDTSEPASSAAVIQRLRGRVAERSDQG
jgi:hypothetical protein